MRSFFKYFFAVILGGIVSTFVILLLAIIIVAAVAASSGESEVSTKPNTILKLDLNGSIVERSKDDPFSEFMGPITNRYAPKGLNQILENIKKAKRDTNIVGIYLQCGAIETGYATIEEIRNALIDFKKSGKFIISYSEIYAQKGYYLATASDKIYLLNEGMLQFQGLTMENIYFKSLFEKIGIEWIPFRHGKFKSGIESFCSDKMSDEDRIQKKELLTGIWDHVLSKVAESRKLDKSAVEAFAKGNSMMSDKELLIRANLIDGLRYEDEVIGELKGRTKTLKDDELEAISFKKYARVNVPDKIDEPTLDKIAIIYAEGVIDGGSKGEGIDSKDLAKTIRKAREDKNIKAIVLRVNSPGGSAMGSDVIWREVLLAKQAKPLVVSMGDLAASGGYYISCVADTILAQISTITGSVGIYAQIPNAKGLKEKVGVTIEGVSTNEGADFLNSLSFITRDWTIADKQIIQSYVDRGYNTFLTRVSDGRKLSVSAVDEIAQGRVWTGLAAQQNKLVDGIGGIDDAILAAKTRAKLKNYKLVELPEQLSPFEQFVKEMGNEAKALTSIELFGINSNDLDVIKSIKSQDPLQARLPFDVAIY